MEEKKTIFDYIGRVFETFGFSVMMLNIFCLLFGEEARGFSTMFSMGKEGLGTATMAQFFSAAAWTVLIRFLFFTDTVIKNLRLVLRTVFAVASIFIVIVLHILVFDWFPADMWLPWVLFFVCYGICFTVGAGVTAFKEKLENKKMEEALARMKKVK